MATLLADCGPEIGLGHLRRSLVLARALALQGMRCGIATRSDAGRDLVAQTGFPALAWPEAAAALGPTDLLVIDSYRIDLSTMRAWRDRAALRLVIDDLADRPLDAELVLNQNLFAERLDYRGITNGAAVLCGPAHALVDPSFHAIGQRRSMPRPRALVSFGGSDDGTLGVRAARGLRSAGFEGPVDIAVSPLRSPSPAALRFASETRGVTLRRGHALSALMTRASFYVGGAGSTVLEAAAARLPMLAIAIAENQHLNIAALGRQGIPALASFDDAAFAAAARRLLADPEAAILKTAVAPDGPSRVALRALARLSRAESASGTGHRA